MSPADTPRSGLVLGTSVIFQGHVNAGALHPQPARTAAENWAEAGRAAPRHAAAVEQRLAAVEAAADADPEAAAARVKAERLAGQLAGAREALAAAEGELARSTARVRHAIVAELSPQSSETVAAEKARAAADAAARAAALRVGDLEALAADARAAWLAARRRAWDAARAALRAELAAARQAYAAEWERVEVEHRLAELKALHAMRERLTGSPDGSPAVLAAAVGLLDAMAPPADPAAG